MKLIKLSLISSILIAGICSASYGIIPGVNYGARNGKDYVEGSYERINVRRLLEEVPMSSEAVNKISNAIMNLVMDLRSNGVSEADIDILQTIFLNTAITEYKSSADRCRAFFSQSGLNEVIPGSFPKLDTTMKSTVQSIKQCEQERIERVLSILDDFSNRIDQLTQGQQRSKF